MGGRRITIFPFGNFNCGSVRVHTHTHTPPKTHSYVLITHLVTWSLTQANLLSNLILYSWLLKSQLWYFSVFKALSYIFMNLVDLIPVNSLNYSQLPQIGFLEFKCICPFIFQDEFDWMSCSDWCKLIQNMWIINLLLSRNKS